MKIKMKTNSKALPLIVLILLYSMYSMYVVFTEQIGSLEMWRIIAVSIGFVIFFSFFVYMLYDTIKRGKENKH